MSGFLTHDQLFDARLELLRENNKLRKENERLSNALEILKDDTTLSFVVRQIAQKALEAK